MDGGEILKLSGPERDGAIGGEKLREVSLPGWKVWLSSMGGINLTVKPRVRLG